MLDGAARATLLADVVQATSTAVDADEVLVRTADLLVRGLVDWAIADRLADPDLVQRVAAVGSGGPLALPPPAGGPGPERRRRSSAATGGLLRQLAAGDNPVLHLGPAALADLRSSSDPRLRGQGELVAGLHTLEAVVLGTGARGRLNGVLSLGRCTTPFSADDVALLGAVALHVGTALEAARLLEAQRSVSAAMQTSLLPPLPRVAGLELAARYQAAARGLEVGGDWYDAFVLPGGGLGVVIGDATGHDTAAAAHMAELRNLLRALAVDRGEPPAGTLARLDRTCRTLGGVVSATCLYAQLDRAGGEVGSAGVRVRWASAGHLPPVLVREGKAQLAETDAEPDLMLGVDPDTERHDHEAVLQPGDLLVLCTDGLVEDRRTPLDERLQVLRDLVGRHPHAHPEALAELLLAELAQDAEDDVALLLVRISP